MAENGSKVNPVTGLTEEAEESIRESWSLLFRKEHRKENAIEFFMILFTQYTEAKDFFDVFKDIPVEKLRSHKKMASHATTAFYSIASLVDSLDDTDTLVELVTKLAKNHLKRNIGPNQMKKLVPVIEELLVKVLGDDCTELMKTSWASLLGVIATVSEACQKEME